jgi:hypothetical protein
MAKRILLGTVVAAGLALAAAGYGTSAAAQSTGTAGPNQGMMGGYGYGMGPGMMGYGTGMGGPGMMGGGWMGPGMMGGPGMLGLGMMGPGMMGPGGARQQIDFNLSGGEVQKYFERSIAMSGNPHIKVANVAEKDADTITADIVTTDKDGLVQRYTVDRHTGFIRPAG